MSLARAPSSLPSASCLPCPARSEATFTAWVLWPITPPVTPSSRRALRSHPGSNATGPSRPPMRPAVLNRVLPDGCSDLIIGIADDPHAHGRRHDAHSDGDPASGRIDLFGIRFHPGAALALLGTPLLELTDRRVALEEIWGPGGVRPRRGWRSDRAGRARGAGRAAAGAASGRLGAQPTRRRSDGARGDLPAPPRPGRRRRRPGGRRAGRRRAAGCSERSAARSGSAPRRWTGPPLSPRPPSLDLSGTAGDRRLGRHRGGAGYADQSHFIRDFKSLAGLTPTRYVAERRDVGFVQYAEEETG